MNQKMLGRNKKKVKVNFLLKKTNKISKPLGRLIRKKYKMH